MQTFLPYADFVKSASVLDYRRLGKQRVEAWQILQCLQRLGSLRWANHLAVRIWHGNEAALALYGRIICDEWIKRGYEDNMWAKFFGEDHNPEHMPPWLGREDFHASHRSNLLRKDPEWYSQFGWTEPHHLPYVWPV